MKTKLLEFRIGKFSTQLIYHRPFPILTLFGNVRAWRRTTQDDRSADDRRQKKDAKKRSIADQRDLFPIKFHSFATILLRQSFLVSLDRRVHSP